MSVDITRADALLITIPTVLLLLGAWVISTESRDFLVVAGGSLVLTALVGLALFRNPPE